jgi:cytochrome c6
MPRKEADVSRAGQVAIPIAVYLLIGTSVAEAASPERLTGNVSEGHTLYQRHCEPCHGANGHGDGSLGMALVPPAADLSASAIQSKSERELLHTILEGKAGTAMPSFRQHLSEKQARDLLAFVRSLAPLR